jgi:putative transposase
MTIFISTLHYLRRSTVADLASAVKSSSSRIYESFPSRRAFAWQEGYDVFSVSKPEENRVVNYFQQQKHHHQKRTFKDEFLEFLEKYQVEYDERYLWDRY